MRHTFFEMFQFMYRAQKNYKVIIIQFSGPLLHMTATSTDSHCIIFVRYNIKVSHGHHACPLYRFQLVHTCNLNTINDIDSLLHDSPLCFDLHTTALCLAIVYGLRMAVYTGQNPLQ
jgi:hypothetical protein